MAIRNRNAKRVKRMVPLLNPDTDFSVAEAYKIIRTNLMFALPSRNTRSLIITSPAPDEGKSTNCCNLGITLAQTGCRVLIMDCDLRKPAIHSHFDKICIPGLSELLAGINGSLMDVIRRTDDPNLDVICGGTIPPNPAELLSGAVMREILYLLYQEYDYILLDTPPVNLVADALALSVMTDGVVIIVKQGQTTYPELDRAIASLTFANAKVLGLILNGAEARAGYGYYRHKKKKYLDYYGYCGGKGSSPEAL